jgi:hypothetical protein
MSREWTREEDEKLVYGYEHVIMPYLASRLSVIGEKYGMAVSYENFREDNERMLELMRQGINLMTNASAIMGIVRQLDPEMCIKTIDKFTEDSDESKTKFDYDRLFEIRQLLEGFVKFKNDIPKEE